MTTQCSPKPLLRGTGKSGRHIFLLCLAISLAASGLLCLMQSMTTYTSDDYYYANFVGDGFDAFLDRNVEHFAARNGRVLVHLAAELWLGFGMIPYALCTTAMLWGIVALFARPSPECALPRGGRFALEAALFFALMTLTSFRVMKGWFLCVADTANYILPLFACGLMLRLLGRAVTRGGMWWTAAAVAALLAGATTEQGGVVAAALTAVIGLHGLITRRPHRRSLILLLPIAIGLATILASPATRQRVGEELSLSGLGRGYLQYAASLAAPTLSLHLLILFCLATGLLPLAGRASRALYAGLPAAALLSLGYLLPRSIAVDAALTSLFFAYAVYAAVVFLRTDAWLDALPIVAALASAGMVMLSQSGSIRVTTPLLLLLLLCTARFAADLAQQLSRRCGGRRQLSALLLVLLALGFCLRMPDVIGMHHNARIKAENDRLVEEARVSGVLHYREYLPRYCLQPLFSNSIITDAYLAYHNLDGITVASTYREGDTVRIGSETATLLDHNDKSCLPLGRVVAGKGGRLRWLCESHIALELNGQRCVLDGERLWQGNRAIDVSDDVFLYMNSTYISLELLERFFGIAVVPAQ